MAKKGRRDSMANNTPSIKRNYVYNTLYEILVLITPLITAPYISRVLGAEKIGIQSFTNSIVTYFTLFAALGTNSYGTREIAMHRDDKEESSRLFWEIELVSVLTTSIAVIIWVIWIFIADKYNVYYMVLTMTLIAVGFDISWYFRGFELFKFIVLRNSLVKIAGIVMLFVFIHEPDDLLLYMAIVASSGLLGNISMWTYLPGRVQRVRLDSLHPLRHLKQTIAYFIPAIATSVYTVLDKTMIGTITGSETQNGYYEQSGKIIKMSEKMLFSLNTVMSARMSYLFASQKTEEIKEKIDKSFNFLFAIAIPLALGLIGISGNFVPWFFGKGYDPVIGYMRLMAPLPVIICVSNILGSQYLTPSGQRVRSSKGIITGAVVNFIFNAILIPMYGAKGAIVGSIVAECTISSIYVYMSKGFISLRQIWNKTWKRLIAGSAMLLAVLFIGRGKTGSVIITVLQITIGILIYSVMLLILQDSMAKEGIKYIRLKFNQIKKR